MKNRRIRARTKVELALIVSLFIGISANSVFGTVTITDVNTTTDESDLEINFLGNWIRVNNIAIDENISVDNLTVSGDTRIGDTYVDGTIVMGSDGFLVSPTSDGGSIRLNITQGGDIYTAGIWTNDGNIRQSGEYWLYNTIGLLYPYVHMSSSGIQVYDGTVAENVVINLTNDGDIVATGNITADNAFLPSFVFAHTNNTIPVAVAGTWYNVTFDEEAASPKLRITHTHSDDTNTTFTIIDPGYYNIHYAMSFSDSQATPSNHIVMRVVKNDVEIAGSLLEEDSTKQYSDFTISNGPIAYLTVGDEIQFQFTSDATTVSLTAHRTYGDHHDTAVVKIVRIA